MLCVKIDAVACYLSPPARRVVPVKPRLVVPIVVDVIVLEIRILHQCQARAVLVCRLHRGIVRRKPAALTLRHHFHAADVSKVDRIVLFKHLAKMGFAEVAGMLQHNVKNNLHAAFVHLVDECLECHVSIGVRVGLSYVAVVDFREVHGMIAVIVEAGTVLDDRRNPHGGKTESLDVVELVDEAFEVATPFRVVHVKHSVPAVGVVCRVAVVEAGGNGKIDCLVAEIRAIPYKRRGV